jgi:hypothetical protein
MEFFNTHRRLHSLTQGPVHREGTIGAEYGGDRHRLFAEGACSTSLAARMTVFFMRFSPAQ